MQMYNYMHKSKIEQDIKDIVKFYMPHEMADGADVDSIAAVADYLEEIGDSIVWDMRTAVWPNVEGGEAFIAWVEDGYLHSYQWTYWN